MSQPISLLIADDHAVLRAGLRLLLASQKDMRVAGECGTHGGVLEFLHHSAQPVDVVTLDLTMPGGSPAALIENIVRHHPHTRWGQFGPDYSRQKEHSCDARPSGHRRFEPAGTGGAAPYCPGAFQSANRRQAVLERQNRGVL